MATLNYAGVDYNVPSYRADDLKTLVTDKLDDPLKHQGSWLSFNDGTQNQLLLIRQGIAIGIRD